MIQHPGFLLIVIGFYFSSTCIIAFSGYEEQKQAAKFVYFIDLFSPRFLPCVILFIWSVFVLSMGLLEIIVPRYFDEICGGILEVLFNVK